MRDLLNAVGDLLRTVAAAELMPRFGRLADSDIRAKPSDSDPTDIVTRADVAVEDWLEPRLTSLLPSSLVIGEERASRDPGVLDLLATQRAVWLVDPLDGTRNYAAGTGPFGVMVALVERDEIVLASIYLPQVDRLYQALRGAGATCNGEPLGARVRSRGALCGTIYTKFMPADVAVRLRARASHAVASGRISSEEPLMCAAHQYAELAEGRQDFAVYHRLLPWDHAPGVLLLREIDGVCRHIDGRDYRASDRSGPALMTTCRADWDSAHAALFA